MNSLEGHRKEIIFFFAILYCIQNSLKVFLQCLVLKVLHQQPRTEYEHHFSGDGKED